MFLYVQDTHTITLSFDSKFNLRTSLFRTHPILPKRYTSDAILAKRGRTHPILAKWPPND